MLVYTQTTFLTSVLLWGYHTLPPGETPLPVPPGSEFGRSWLIGPVDRELGLESLCFCASCWLVFLAGHLAVSPACFSSCLNFLSSRLYCWRLFQIFVLTSSRYFALVSTLPLLLLSASSRRCGLSWKGDKISLHSKEQFIRFSNNCPVLKWRSRYLVGIYVRKLTITKIKNPRTKLPCLCVRVCVSACVCVCARARTVYVSCWMAQWLLFLIFHTIYHYVFGLIHKVCLSDSLPVCLSVST